MITKSPSSENDSRSSFSSTRKLSSQRPLTNQNSSKYPRYEKPANWPYKAHITADKSHIHDQDPSTKCTTTVTAGSPVQVTEDDCKLRKTSSAGQAGVRRRNNAAMDANTAAWGYAKVAMLMFVALFIVWVSLPIFSFPPLFYIRLGFAQGLVSTVPCVIIVERSWLYERYCGCVRYNLSEQTHLLGCRCVR